MAEIQIQQDCDVAVGTVGDDDSVVRTWIGANDEIETRTAAAAPWDVEQAHVGGKLNDRETGASSGEGASGPWEQ